MRMPGFCNSPRNTQYDKISRTVQLERARAHARMLTRRCRRRVSCRPVSVSSSSPVSVSEPPLGTPLELQIFPAARANNNRLLRTCRADYRLPPPPDEITKPGRATIYKESGISFISIQFILCWRGVRHVTR